ncbi:MAG TPA: DUF3987 domain-containing protein, partial [Chloroflexota bacterium]|nr:DUF3987 domain-containing protein [Chloroflexota bacterium]
MVALGSVVGRALGVRPSQYDDYITDPNLWGATILDSGTMKSSSAVDAHAPIRGLAWQARSDHQADREARRARLEAEVSQRRSELGSACRTFADVTRAEKALAKALRRLQQSKVAERRFIVEDSTVEKIAELLSRPENHNGLLVVRDELSGLIRSMDKPERAGDR